MLESETKRLSLEEVEARYNEVEEEFEKVKSHYSGFFGRFRRNIRDCDQKSLIDCISTLLPLMMEGSVQSQTRQTQCFEDTLFYQLQCLNTKVMDYLANFKNSGITRI